MPISANIESTSGAVFTSGFKHSGDTLIYVLRFSYLPLVCAKLYEHRDHTGDFMDVNNGENPSFIQSFWNDEVTSIIVMPGCTLALYENADFGGRKAQHTKSVALLDQFWNDQVSSYDCSCQKGDL